MVDMMVKFISYTGKWPCLCMGVFTVQIDGKIYKFGHETQDYDFRSNKYKDNNFSDFWRSGGRICGNNDGGMYAEQEEWLLDEEEHKDYPKEIKEKLSELIEVFNENVPHGCCGGCI